MMESLTEGDSGLEEILVFHGCIQIQLISMRSALEAFESMKLQVFREATARRTGGAMDRARATELIPAAFARCEADQGQDISQRNPGPDLSEGNARHNGSRLIERGGPQGGREGKAPGKQRRGTRSPLM